MSRRTKIKTVDVSALKWFDRINGNMYFAGWIDINYGMKGERNYIMRFQYGYDRQWEHAAMDTLRDKEGIDMDEKYTYVGQWCRESGVIYRGHVWADCKKAELLALK